MSASERLGVRLNPPYLQGVYLALNAIPDAYFLGDGPSCLFSKAESIHGRHDLFSTLLSCASDHRIQHTGIGISKIASNYEAEIVASLTHIASWPLSGAIFMGSMPMCAVAGMDYGRVMRQALSGTGKPFFVIPQRKALSGDWLDGYAAVLEVLAADMDFQDAKPQPGNVAVVGCFMDRNEGDHRGNIREIERMLRALRLNPVSIWLSGRPYDDLREAGRAEAIVSLPHGRKAARILAERLGARLIEADIPFGLAATRRFIEQVGAGFGRERAADRFIRRELDEVMPRLAWSVPHAFLHRRFAFAGDPHYAVRFSEMIEELGGEIAGLLLIGGDHHLSSAQKVEIMRRPKTAFEPLAAEICELWGDIRCGETDVIVANTAVIEILNPETAWLEFGFPSERTHCLRDEPFLGFQGALAFLSRTANEVVRGLGVRK